MHHPIKKIYQYYHLPQNLQRHMIEVTAVGSMITDHWQGPEVDRELVTTALLVHDLGNIAKFRQPFIGEMAQNSERWLAVQKNVRLHYGGDAHSATQAMLLELGISDDVRHLVDTTGAYEVVKHGYFSDESRIADYADMCVAPGGITDFDTRLADLIVRYQLAEDNESIKIRRENAEYVAKNVDFDLKTMKTIDFSDKVADFWDFSVEISDEAHELLHSKTSFL